MEYLRQGMVLVLRTPVQKKVPKNPKNPKLLVNSLAAGSMREKGSDQQLEDAT